MVGTNDLQCGVCGSIPAAGRFFNYLFFIFWDENCHPVGRPTTHFQIASVGGRRAADAPPTAAAT
jgi:hypothetical protein